MFENKLMVILIFFSSHRPLFISEQSNLNMDSSKNHKIEAEFVKDYFNERSISVAVIFACTLHESTEMVRSLRSNRTVVAKYYYFDMGQFFIRMMTAPYNKIGVYLNYSCAFGRYIFSRSSKDNLFSERYVWLLINENKNLINRFERFNLQLDTDMVIAVVKSHHVDAINNYAANEANCNDSDNIFDTNDFYNYYSKYNYTIGEHSDIILYDLYKIQKYLPVVSTYAGFWNLDNRLIMELYGTKISRRSDFQGIVISGAGVLSQTKFIDFAKAYTDDSEMLNLLTDVSYGSHLDIVNRYPLVMNVNLAKMYNFKLNVTFSKDWGTVKPDGFYSGMLGEIQTGRAELGLTTVIMRTSLSDIMEFSFPIWKFRPIFIYSNPRRFGTYLALVAPFTNEAWLFVIILIFAIIFILTLIKRFAIHDNDTDETFGLNFVVIIGAMSAQGLSSCSNRLPERIILYMALIIGMLLTTFYNSMVVTSLLQPPPPNIQQCEQLVESNIRIGINNRTSFIKYFQNSNDGLVKSIYKKASRGNGFMNTEKGVDLVRKTRFSFYDEEAAIYPVITDTYSKPEVCNLVEIQLISPSYLPCPFKKGSPLKQFVNSGFHLMRERGIIMRERNVWHRSRPRCQGNDVPSIQLQTLIVAYAIFLSGIFLSFVIFIFEVVLYKRKLVHKRRTSTNVGSIIENDDRMMFNAGRSKS